MRLGKSGKLKILVLISIFISVIFIFPAELVAETYKFWVDTSHSETKPIEYRKWILAGNTKTEMD